jgi:hypothetical protein
MSDPPPRFSPGQTALVVEIPEVRAAVGAWRARFDTSAAAGVGPHVTVLFPFLTLPAVTAADRADLAALVTAEPAFTVTLGAWGTFSVDDPAPDILYLVPSPSDPFRRLTESIAARWPQCPPYGGLIDDPTPHLTVTETAAATDVDAARRAVEPLLPITAPVRGVTMIAFDGSAWRPDAWFPLGESRSPVRSSARDHPGAVQHQRTPGRRGPATVPGIDPDDAPNPDQ